MLQRKINPSIGKKNKGGTGLGRLLMGGLSKRVKLSTGFPARQEPLLKHQESIVSG